MGVVAGIKGLDFDERDARSEYAYYDPLYLGERRTWLSLV